MIRCLKCGCSRLDPKGYKCALCGGAPGLRSEQVYVSEETKAILLAHSEELRQFGITLEEHETLGKSVDYVKTIGLALAIANSLRPGVLRDLVLLLRKIAISEEEILRLRLDEPEQILTYCRMDKADGNSVSRL
jgi:hypothetical protein